MSTLNSALQVAVRLHEGDLADSSTHALGAVTSENAWVMFDIAQLRMHASSAGIAAPREGVRLLEQLVDAWSMVSDPVAARFPVSRLADRLELKAVACARYGKPCPPPKPPKSPKC